MTAAEDLVCRYLALWQDYVTALLTDLALPDGTNSSPCVGDPGSDDQPIPGQHPASESPAGTATAAGASHERDDAVADLARRLARLEERIAALERARPPAARARGRDRGARR